MKYEIIKNTREISYKNRKEIKEGCTLEQDNMTPEIMKSFDNKDEALKELKSYESDIRRLSGAAGTYYNVTEYHVEENEYDENGEWISGGDVWGISKMPMVDSAFILKGYMPIKREEGLCVKWFV